jgi:nitrite reductase/ring-hydroxylating ferredoxin subunit
MSEDRGLRGAYPSAGGAEVRLCNAEALQDGGPGLRFDVMAGGSRCPAFAIRHGGRVHAYLNRCAHVPMELDWVAGQFLDAEQGVLVCSTHGALYEPETGRCVGGPCSGRGGLRPLSVQERERVIYWQPDAYATALAASAT